MELYNGRVAAVTGGADGIGRALAEALAAAGMAVAILDVRGEAAQETAAAIIAAGGKAQAYVCDVTLYDQLEATAMAVKADLGAVSLLCVNAGVGAAGGMISASPKAIDWVFAVNVRGVIDTLRAFVPRMDDESGPRHVCFTASSASLTSPSGPLALYAGSKHATIGVAEAAAAELETMGIGCTILCPGLINTRIWDGARARPEHFGGPRFMPEATGDHWRTTGMAVDWVAEEALKAIAANARYCAPIDAHSADDFEMRASAIRAGFALWQDRDRTRWPDPA